MKTRIFITLTLCSFLILVSVPLESYANTNQQLDFSNTSDKYLFDLSNMKPGDFATRNFEIQNSVGRDFKYHPKVKFISGSKKLYNEFDLIVEDNNGFKIYVGKLQEFEGMNARLLRSGDKETLTFEAKFPYELGNEFQGLSFEFELHFIMEDIPQLNPTPTPDLDLNQSYVTPNNHEVEDVPVDSQAEGRNLPSTATKMFNLILIGIAILICGSCLYILHVKRKRIE